MMAEMCLVRTYVLNMGRFRTRDSEQKLTHRRFPLNVKEHFCIEGDRALAQVTQRGCVAFEMLISHLDMIWLQVALIEQGGWARASLEINFSCSVLLWFPSFFGPIYQMYVDVILFFLDG